MTLLAVLIILLALALAAALVAQAVLWRALGRAESQVELLQASNDLFSHTLVDIKDLCSELSPSAYRAQVGEIRGMFSEVFSAQLAFKDSNLLLALDRSESLVETQQMLVDSLAKRDEQMEAHSRQAYLRLQTLAHLIRPLADPEQAELSSLPDSPLNPDMVEVIGPEGASRFFAAPARANEAVHPEIGRALATPGFRIRYPDGREEVGNAG